MWRFKEGNNNFDDVRYTSGESGFEEMSEGTAPREPLDCLNPGDGDCWSRFYRSRPPMPIGSIS